MATKLCLLLCCPKCELDVNSVTDGGCVGHTRLL